tara:strand:- start:262 stop:477 length:216 start_codon:yes stop_codon:yes gene_type:complete
MSELIEVCPICEWGVLESKVESNEVTYKNVTKNIPLYYSICDFCEMEQADSKQTNLNKLEMIRFREEVDSI